MLVREWCTAFHCDTHVLSCTAVWDPGSARHPPVRLSSGRMSICSDAELRRSNLLTCGRGAAVVEASAGVLAAVPDEQLAERGVLLHSALRLLAAFADDPLCTRGFCHSGRRFA